MSVRLALGLIALALVATPIMAEPALTAEQANALAGVWELESGHRLYGVDYDDALIEAAANGTIDPQALLESALNAQPGPPIKFVIGAVDTQTGAFVGYRLPETPDEHIPPLLRIVGIASADGTGPNATIVWKGVENDETASNDAIVKDGKMHFVHFDPQDVFNGSQVVDPSGLMTRVLVKNTSASVEEELKAIAQLLPLGPVPTSGGNLAQEAAAPTGAAPAPKAAAGAPPSAAAGVAPQAVALLAAAALMLAQLA